MTVRFAARQDIPALANGGRRPHALTRFTLTASVDLQRLNRFAQRMGYAAVGGNYAKRMEA